MSISTGKQKSSWKILPDSKSKINPVQSVEKQKKQDTKKINFKILPYLAWMAVLFLLIGFNGSFRNLNADIFGETGQTGKFGLPALNSDIPALSDVESVSQTGSVETASQSTVLNTVQTTVSNENVTAEDEQNLNVEWQENLHNVATTAVPIQVTQTAIPENTNKVPQAVNVVPVAITQVVEKIQPKLVTGTPYRINSHTYDKVGQQAPLVIKKQVPIAHQTQIVQTQKGEIKAKKTPNAGPEENIIILFSLVFSGLAWWGLRKKLKVSRL